MPPAAASTPTADVLPLTIVEHLLDPGFPNWLGHLPRYGMPFPSTDNPAAPEDAYRVRYPMQTMELYHREARRGTRRYGTTRCLTNPPNHA